jgi:ParB family transcriptional regulator, chromosome partitioning protein
MALEAKRSSGGLGRGLAALIPQAIPGISSTRELPVGSIQPHPDQPRQTFDPEGLQQLADSIAEFGVLQPVIVTESGDRFTLVAGERRLRAAMMAGLATIPATVRNANELEQLEIALVENIQRTDLNAVEEARAFQHLMDAFALTQERVAQRVGRSRPAVANTLRILETSPRVQQAVTEGTVTAGHARALAGLHGHAQQEALLATVSARGLSVRQTEALVAAARDGAVAAPQTRSRVTDPDVAHMEAQVREALGTKVTITPGRKGGRITIAWYDDEDLGRLVDRLTTLDR